MAAFSYPAVDQVVDGIVFQPLWIPGSRRVFQPAIILGGQNLVAGSVLGRITASGKYQLAVAAASDGSQVPIAILPEDLSTFAADGATALDMSMSVVFQAMVNPAALVFGAGLTWASTSAGLNARGIFGRYPGYSG